jgi:hypothetical protein
MVMSCSMNCKENCFLVPEHSSHTLSDGEGLLELIWFIQEMRMHPLFGLLFCFFIFVMSTCLIPYDSFVKTIFSFIMVLLKKH